MQKVNDVFGKNKRLIFGVAFSISLYGFLLGVVAPWVAVNQAKKYFNEQLALQLNVEKFRINPFSLTVAVEQLNITNSDHESLLGFDRFFLNFQMSSLFRWAWTLRDLQLLGGFANVERYTEQDTTLSRILETWSANQPVEHQSTTVIEPAESTLPRFLVRNIELNVKNIAFVDHVPATAYRGQVGPVSLHVKELSSLPDYVGMHSIVIADKNGTEVSWQGNINLSPLSSQGNVAIKSPYPVMISEYLQDTLPIHIQSANVYGNFKYKFTSRVPNLPEEKYKFDIANANFGIENLVVNERSNNSPLIGLKSFSIQNAEIHWPAQTVEIDNIVFDKGEVWAAKDAGGVINFQRIADALSDMAPSDENPIAGPGLTHTAGHNAEGSALGGEPAPASAQKKWRLKNNRLGLQDWLIHWGDESIPSYPKLDVSKLNFFVEDFDSAEHSSVTFGYGMSLFGGTIDGLGALVPSPFGALDVKTNINQLQLNFAQPYLDEFVKVSLDSGTLSGSVNVKSVDSSFDISSNVVVAKLNVIEKASQASLLSWQELTINDIALNSSGNILQINKISLNAPYGEFVIAKDGTSTIDNILISSKSQVQESNVVSVQKGSSDDTLITNEPSEYFFKVGSVQVENGGGYFSDASLPLPFSTKIHQLNGGISAIDSQSQQPADLTMEGQLDEYGLLTVNGSISPFSLLEKSNVSLLFKNINIPNFTPYAVKFAGRKVTEGRLDLDLKYSFKDGKVNGNNKLLLKKFQLGESVNQPGAADLPLDLAVALLKDASGAIDLQVPVSGDANNPEFSVAAVAGQALAKIIMSAVTSPFKLLAGLVGQDSEDFGKISFMAGRSDITPPEREKLVLLAKAMTERPNLNIQYGGVFDEKFDRAFLQKQKFNQVARDFFGEKSESLALTSSQYMSYLETQYREAKLSPELKDLKETFYSGVDKKTFDDLAYASQIKDRLIALESISLADLTALGNTRAVAIKSIITASGIETARLIKTPPKRLKVKVEDALLVELKVTAGK